MKEREYKFKTIEEYREYQRQVSKAWYERNKEYKNKYSMERYYRLKAEAKEKETNQ